MASFVEGLLAGYGIAVPVGAIAVLIIEAGLRCGFRTGFMAGAGAATADLLYAAVATAAGVTISALLVPWSLPLRLLGGTVLIGLALRGLRRGWRSESTDGGAVADCAPGRQYLRFLGLTIINPLTVIYFGALVIGRNLQIQADEASQVLFVAGAAVASLSWQTLLAAAGSLARRGLPGRFRQMAVLAGNFIVLALGVRIIILAVIK